MVSRRLALLLSLALLAVLLVGVTDIPGDPEPELTIENEDDVTYYVSAYTVDDADTAGYLNFEVTTEDDEHRLVTLADLVWPSGHRNVTLADDDVDSQEIVVEPGENVTTTVEDWESGELTIYIVERGEDRTHEWTRTVTCGDRGQEHRLRFGDDSGAGYTCAGGLGWLLG